MLKQPIFLFLFVLIAVIAILHRVALELYLYWTLWWFDILMHFLGGLWVGLSVLWLVFLSGYIKRIPFGRVQALVITIVSVFVVATSWEVFELWSGILTDDSYFFDTSIDLGMGVLGAMSGYLYIFLKYLKNNTT